MRKIIRDAKGAVTVFVTLLLIPAMLVSGTAVDLARMHTARSIIQDANQLAANTVLTQYNALLQDLYGLMGVAKDDPVLWELLDEYIKVTIFGDIGHDRSLGTLQLFYGSNLSMEELDFPDLQNLRTEDVLRRQIEEYMKFRGPVILVMEFIDSLVDNKLKDDAQIMLDKLEIDAAIAAMFNKYRELYEAILVGDRLTQITGIAGGSFASLSSRLTFMRAQFAELSSIQSSWASLDPKDDDYVTDKAELEAYYSGIVDNLRAYTIGGSRGSNWSNGRWTIVTTIPTGLNAIVENAKVQADNYKSRFDTVVTIAREIDAMNAELSLKIDELERKLSNGECSAELAEALTRRQGTPPKSILESYRDILKWNIEELATAFKNGGYNYIDNIHKPMLDGVRYRNINNPSGASLSRSELASVPFGITSSSWGAGGTAAVITGYPDSVITYRMLPGFQKFAEHSTRHNAFFTELQAMMNQDPLPPVRLYDGQENASGGSAERQQRNLISSVLNLVNTAYTGLTNNPIGAGYISDSDASTIEKPNILEILATLPSALASPVLGIIQDPLSEIARMGDYVLLLTYCTSMFSNYTSARPESIGKTRDNIHEVALPPSVSGVPMSPEVNYFFQSEWEYLYNGSEKAAENLSAVTNLIFLLRLVCNYIVVFNVSEVTAIVSSIKAAFSWAPPLGIVLSELARAAFVAAESALDVAALRTGHKVPLLKNPSAGEWICSPSGLANALARIMTSEASGGSGLGYERGFTYSQYMLFFFVTKAVVTTLSGSDAADELAVRTGNLIEWNVINYQSGSFSDEVKMGEALAAPGRFRLEDMKTGFSITTTVDMRMLFLSMVFAQNFSDSRGIGMPRTVPIIVTDYRGY